MQAPQRLSQVTRAPGEPPAAILSPQRVVRGYDTARQRWLLNIISIGVAIPALVLLPSGLFPTLDRATVVACSIAFAFALVAWVVNRTDHTRTAGIMLVLGLAIAVGWEMLSKAFDHGGLDLADLRLYDLFVLPILLAGVLIGRRATLLTGLTTATFTVVTLLTMPRTHNLQIFWNGNPPPVKGSFYDVIAVPIVIQALTAVAAALAADSVRRALSLATQADELGTIYRQVNEQSYLIESQRHRLREGIAQMQQAVAAFGRGNFDVRPQASDSDLAPLSASLNALFDQMRRQAREQHARARVDQGAAELAAALRAVRNGRQYTPPNYTGTALDQVLVELATLRLAGLPGANGREAPDATAGPPSFDGLWSESPPSALPNPPSVHDLPVFGEAPPPVEDPANQLPSWLRTH